MENENETQSEPESEVDPIVQGLGDRLIELEKKYGLNSDTLKPAGAYGLAGQIIRRLSEVERKVGVDGLPVQGGAKIISTEQVSNPSFLRRHSISIEDIATGKVKVQDDKN